MIQILEVVANAIGIETFVQQVRLSGSTCQFNEARQSYEVFARGDYSGQFDVDPADPDPAVIEHIRTIEIGGPFEELLSLNADEQEIIVKPSTQSAPSPEKRAGSLDDILRSRTVQQSEIETDIEEAGDREGSMEQEEREEREFQDQMNEAEDAISPRTDLSLDGSGTALERVAGKISAARKADFLKGVEKLLGVDLTSDLEILQELSESGEAKRMLSILLAQMDVRISFTAVSQNLRDTRSGTVVFRPDQIASIEHYRSGCHELLRVIDRLRAEQDSLAEIQQRARGLERDLETQRTTAAAEAAKLREAADRALTASIPQELFKARYSLTWVMDGTRFFLAVAQGAEPAKTDPVEFPLKKVGAVQQQTRAYRFVTLADAKAQRARMLNHPENCAFLGGKAVPKVKIVRLGLDVVRED